MLDPVIVCRDFLEFLLTSNLNNEVIPTLEKIVGSFRDVHALHCLASLYAVLSIYNPELLVSNLLPRSQPLGCLGHQTKCLPSEPVGHVDEVVSGCCMPCSL